MKVIDTIKSRGYWRVNFEPMVFIQKLPTVEDCKSYVEKNSVNLRGWDYPHVPRRRGQDTDLSPGSNFYQGWVDTGIYKEFWKMYQSGQFINYRALKEDWFDENSFAARAMRGSPLTPEPMSSLEVINTTYQITEFFVFLSRLVGQGLYNEGVSVSISLNNTEGRKLWISDFNRAPFIDDYKTASPTIVHEQKLSKQEALAQPKELAMRLINKIFDSFGWHKPSVGIIKQDMDEFLKGKLGFG